MKLHLNKNRKEKVREATCHARVGGTDTGSDAHMIIMDTACCSNQTHPRICHALSPEQQR